MRSFHWDKHFVTGLTEVDHQHHHLVDLINKFGNLVSENDQQKEDVDMLFAELSDYAEKHFREEETLMKEAYIDSRHFNHHHAVHKRFLGDVTSLYSEIIENNLEQSTTLLEYLIHWLAYHILGEDQDMARQIKAIQSGMSPGEAYDELERQRNSSTAPLLNALDGLFELVSRQNRELKHLNQSLEEIVAHRTRQLTEANIKLEELSQTDALTGLPNRRYAMRLLSKVWNESSEQESPLVCMMVDADHFKEVNDEYGHDAGDNVLIELSKTLKNCLKKDDTVCRLGGDEFLVICPNKNKEAGIELAEKIRKTVSVLRATTGGKPWHGSVSIGVAYRTSEMKHYEELIKASDMGVYAAKVAGKNCARVKD